MKTMSPKQRGLVARRALLDYLKCVRALDALQKTMPLVDGEPYAPLAGLGIGGREVLGAIEQLEKAVGLNRRAAECLERLGRSLRPGETVLGVLQGDE